MSKQRYSNLIRQVQQAKVTATGKEWSRLHRVESELALAAGLHESTSRTRARAKKRGGRATKRVGRKPKAGRGKKSGA